MRTRKIGLVGVPMDLGGNLRGVDMGPSAVRHANLQQRLEKVDFEVQDFGNIEVPVRAIQHEGTNKARFLNEITIASQKLSDKVYQILKQGYMPLCVGGDHAIAVGSIAGVSKFYREQKQDFGVLWVDAHGDLNTPQTTPSGNIHGMPAAIALGYGPKELVELEGFSPKFERSDLALIGLRDLDKHEITILSKGDIPYYTMVEIDEYGTPAIIHDALKRVTKNYTRPIHLSLDMDSVDPGDAPGVGTPVVGGLTLRESHYIMEVIAEAKLQDGRPVLQSMDLVEINPTLDIRNQTALLGVELSVAALAERPLSRRSLRDIEKQSL